MAALTVLGVAFLLTAELAHAQAEPASGPTTTTSAGSAPATASEPPASPSSDPAAPPVTGAEESVGTDLETLLDAVVEASDGEVSEDGGTGDDDPDTPLLDPGDEPGSSHQLATADAGVTQDGAANANVTVKVDDPGDTGKAGQGNSANAQANASANASKPKDDGDDPDEAAAQAKADAKQSNPKNTNVEVRVDSPGDAGPVDQSNAAGATAGASGTGTAGSQTANASAAQTSPQNVNVVVRVDSPGDNGPVTQSNTATATAGTNPPTPTAADVTGAGAGGTFETDQLVTTSGSSTVTNDGTLAQEIDQDQGGNPPAAPGASSSAGSSASSTSGSASATQANALNANVSIRIDSPGSDGAVNQSNKASKQGPDGKVVTVTGGSNVDIALSLAGSLAANGGLESWVWNWVWDGGWAPPAGLAAPGAAPTEGSLWNWLWQAAAAPAAGTSAPAAPATASQPAEEGFWLWTWRWTFEDESTWTLDWKVACECRWVWNWTWDWSDETPALEAAPAAVTETVTAASAAPFDPATDGGPVTQLNSVTASATAIVELEATEEIVQTQAGSDPALELQGAWAGQRLVNHQIAQAAAEAVQADPWNANVTIGFPIESVDQSNTATAEADAASLAEVAQIVVQAQEGDDSTAQWVEAEQWAANEQTSIAAALVVQSDAANVNLVRGGPADEARLSPVEQANEADATALATSEATIVQVIGQAQAADLAVFQSASATQLHANVQTALAAAVVTQDRTENLHDVRVPAGSRATNPSLRQRNIVFTESSSQNRSLIDAWILQTQAGSTDIELSRADQQGVVAQIAEAYSPASQLDLLNRAGWLGIEPPAPEEPMDGEEVADTPPSVIETPSSTYLVVTTSPGVVTVRSLTSASAEKISRGGTVRLGRLGGMLTAGMGDPGAHARETPAALKPPARPWKGLGPGTIDVPPVAVPGHSARPATSELPLSSGRTKSTSVDEDECAAILGTSGCAPHTGGGGSALLMLATHELAAPAHIGPHVPGSVLGRPIEFLEPFERPG